MFQGIQRRTFCKALQKDDEYKGMVQPGKFASCFSGTGIKSNWLNRLMEKTILKSWYPSIQEETDEKCE